MGQYVQLLSITLSGLIIALTNHPYYALALLAYIPGLTCIFGAFMKSIMGGVTKKMEMNAKLGAFTEEILSSLKLIISFGKEK